jgi:hypothetical protein
VRKIKNFSKSKQALEIRCYLLVNIVSKCANIKEGRRKCLVCNVGFKAPLLSFAQIFQTVLLNWESDGILWILRRQTYWPHNMDNFSWVNFYFFMLVLYIKNLSNPPPPLNIASTVPLQNCFLCVSRYLNPQFKGPLYVNSAAFHQEQQVRTYRPLVRIRFSKKKARQNIHFNILLVFKLLRRTARTHSLRIRELHIIHKIYCEVPRLQWRPQPAPP